MVNELVVATAVGDLREGIIIHYRECQYDWHWLYKQELLIISHEPTAIGVSIHPDYFTQEYLSCESGHPAYAYNRTLPLIFNMDPCEDCCIPPRTAPVGTEGSSWGAI
jgi:hypothetical protein